MRRHKNRLLLLLSALCGLVSAYILIPSSVAAHVRGVPVLKINNQITKIYFDEFYTGSVFNIPADADKGADNYVVNQLISFEIDTTKFPTPPEIFEKTDIIWDFGDGSPKQSIINGSKNNHTYTKTGTFAVVISADYSSAGFPNLELQPLQTVLINVLPSGEYQLPKPLIKVNGQVVSEDGKRIVETDLNKRLTFDASDSQKGTTKNITYRWDFGQGGKENTNKVATYRYKLPQYAATVVLRIEDENGYYADTFINVRNNGTNEANNSEADESKNFFAIMGLAMGLTVTAGVSGLWFVSKIKKNKH